MLAVPTSVKVTSMKQTDSCGSWIPETPGLTHTLRQAYNTTHAMPSSQEQEQQPDIECSVLKSPRCSRSHRQQQSIQAVMILCIPATLAQLPQPGTNMIRHSMCCDTSCSSSNCSAGAPSTSNRTLHPSLTALQVPSRAATVATALLHTSAQAQLLQHLLN